MQTPGYSSATELLADRIRWSRVVLARAIDEGRSEGWLDGPRIGPVEPERIATELVSRMAATTLSPALLPMEWMALRLQLTARELSVLWLLACVELSPAVARLAEVLTGSQSSDLTVLLLRHLIGLTDSEFETLARLGLIELARSDQPHTRRAVRANDRVVALARGELGLDAAIDDFARVHGPASPSAAPPAALVRGLQSTPSPFVVAVGVEGSGRTTLLAQAGARSGTLRVQTRDLAREPALLQRQIRAVLREACLFNVIPLFQDMDEAAATISVLERELRDFNGPVLATATSPIRIGRRPVIVHRVEKPTRATRAALWREHLGAEDVQVAEKAAEQYALWPGAIVAAAKNARALSLENDVTSEVVHAGIRAHLGEALGEVATRVDTTQTWDDVVLPREHFDQLIELVARVRQRGKVLETWGFADKIGRGTGVAALFSGPPGTGKTMVAGLIAHELGLDLYQVDLSKVVSKYIGETEKQLATLFDAAESGQAIVLFDEADSLFAKRSEVKSSNDRYANLEVNYLLQRLDAFTGVALLTTNHERSIDEAFRRRIAVHVRFPMPEEAQRAELWRSMLPAEAEVAPDIEVATLAHEFELSPGYIKNAVVRAAFLAAEANSAITMTHLWRAARAEYEGIGKIAFQRAA